jgi:hypothetical protein
MKKTKQTGSGALWKTKCPPCYWMKKYASRYIAKFIAGHCILHQGQEFRLSLAIWAINLITYGVS